MKLTVGLPCYNNFTEVWFTVQSLRLHHADVFKDKNAEILIVDNFGDDFMQKFFLGHGGGIVRCEKYTEIKGTSNAKNKVFELARGDMVLCIDSHVLLKPGALEDFPVTDDLIHGPMVHADNLNYCCEWLPEWRGQMWGIWGKNYSLENLPTEPFEIWGNGMGCFATSRAGWLGFNGKFRGFGGEEGYLSEKYRKAGRHVMCRPSLVWMHMFDRKIPYPLNLLDRIRNYLIGFEELGLDSGPIVQHFGEKPVADARKLYGTI